MKLNFIMGRSTLHNKLSLVVYQIEEQGVLVCKNE